MLFALIILFVDIMSTRQFGITRQAVMTKMASNSTPVSAFGSKQNDESISKGRGMYQVFTAKEKAENAPWYMANNNISLNNILLNNSHCIQIVYITIFTPLFKWFPNELLLYGCMIMELLKKVDLQNSFLLLSLNQFVWSIYCNSTRKIYFISFRK